MMNCSLTTGISTLGRSALSSSKKSSEGVLIAVKRDVDVIYTRHGLRIEHECVRVNCSEYSYYICAVYLAPDVGEPAYDMFVEDMFVHRRNCC
jgi:hypothetical protein